MHARVSTATNMRHVFDRRLTGRQGLAHYSKTSSRTSHACNNDRDPEILEGSAISWQVLATTIKPLRAVPTCNAPCLTHFPNTSPILHNIVRSSSHPSPRAPQPPRKLNILLHNRHSLRMNRTQISILKQMHQKRLAGLLQRLYRLTLPP